MKQLLFLYLIIFLSRSVHADLNSDLLAYYPFNSNANDATGNGYDGTTTDVTFTTDRFANPNSALQFDGYSSGVEIPKIFAMQAEQTFTVWVNPSSSSGYQGILEKAIPGYGGEVDFQLTLPNNGIYADGLVNWIVNTDNGATGLFAAAVSHNPLPLGQWSFLACVIDQANNQVCLYVNGVLVGSGSMGGRVVRNENRPFRIGKQIGDQRNLSFNGLIDDVKIYNRALSNTEVASLYAVESIDVPFGADINALPTIQLGKPHPTYGYPFNQQPGKNSLIVITHGRIPSGDNPAIETEWVDSMSNSVVEYLDKQKNYAWQVEGYKWIDGAQSSVFDVLGNAHMEGLSLGNLIVSLGTWTHIHLIGHSAGAEVIQACSEVIRAKFGNTCTIHCTFLDPYTGPIPDIGILNNPQLNYASIYGNAADWSDDYFTVDQQTLADSWPVTQGHIDHAYAVDVTYLDKNKIRLNGFTSDSGEINEPCQKTESTHGWPINFYMNTISGDLSEVYDAGYYGSFGFPLSEEGQNWNLVPSYTRGNDPAQILGIPDSACTALFESYSGLFPAIPMDFSNPLQTDLQLEYGNVSTIGKGLNLQADDPAWLTRFISITNPVNYIAFDAQFTTVQKGGGELSVYWDTNAIGFTSEALIGTNLEHYSFSFLPAFGGIHMIGFRLDDLTSNALTSLSITNVVMAYVGVSHPFTLSITTNIIDGLPELMLAGEPGFNYKIQAATNAASTNWMDIAVLINSNGTVAFVDFDSTNYRTRFYRAVAPY